MKKNNFLFIPLALLLLLSSCASSIDEIKSVFSKKEESKDLAKSFEISKDVINSYQEEPIKESDLVIDNQSETQKIIIKKEVKNTVAAAKKVAEKNTKTTTATVTEKKEEIALVKVRKMPADYPQEYKNYDKKARKFWDDFEPRYFVGEQSIIAVTYLGVTAGYITIESKPLKKVNGQDVFHYYARMKSSDSYRYFYWLDDSIESYVNIENFLPVKYELIQREKKQNVDDLQLFDFSKMMTYHWYKRVKEGKNKEEKVEQMIPSLATDSFSALQFVRGLPLDKGDVYEFPVITRGKFWLLKTQVLGEETITINKKDVKAIKIKAETNFPGVLKKSGDIIFWYGNDEFRKLLKFQAKVKLGSINGELIDYIPGKKVEVKIEK